MKTIKIIVDEEIPSIHLLNNEEFIVYPCDEKGDVFGMTRKGVHIVEGNGVSADTTNATEGQ